MNIKNIIQKSNIPVIYISQDGTIKEINNLVYKILNIPNNKVKNIFELFKNEESFNLLLKKILKEQTIERHEIFFNSAENILTFFIPYSGCMLLIFSKEQENKYKRKIDEIEKISDVIHQINSSLKMDKILNTIFTHLIELFNFDGMCIQLVENKTKLKTMKIYHEGASKEELLEMENLIYDIEIANNSIKNILQKGEYLLDKNTLFVPLTVMNERIGVLSVSNFKNGLQLSDEDIKSIKRYAGYISTALNNSNLYEHIEKVNNILKEKDELISKDLNLAKRIQARILNQKIKEYKNIKISIDYIPLIEVGGDFYDISLIEFDDKIIRIIIADATGHGISAGFITMLLKSEYEKIKNLYSSPAELFYNFNKNFYHNYNELGYYTTAFIVDINPENKTITYCNAGHPEQIYITPKKIELLTTKGGIIGFSDLFEYEDQIIHFEKGDKLFLFTDGIFEEFNDKNEIYGENRFYNFIRNNCHLSLEQMKNLIINDVYNFTGKNNFEDDVTFLKVEL